MKLLPVHIWVLIFVTFFLTVPKSLKSQTKEVQPNIVLFFVDDLGWSDLGFRNSVFKTPNIDKLAKESLSFEQAYIASPTCSPSRATLLTGQHPARLKMVRHIPGGKKNGFDQYDRTSVEFNYLERDPAQFPSRNWLPLENITYAEALEKVGYYNLFIGKWHLGHEDFHPIHQGFHKQIGTSNDGHPKSYYPPYFKRKDVFAEDKNTYLTDKLTNEAVDFINNYNKNQPFMLTFSYYSVHSPHQGRKDLVDFFENKGLEGKFAHYAAMVKAMDESVGRVLTAIQNKGNQKETLIIFLSDQGGYFSNWPFRGGKMKETLFEGGARVPFLVHWPGVTKPGTINHSVVQSTDVFPTLLELAGADKGNIKEVDGVSLLNTIKENSELERGPVFGYRAYEDLYVSVRQKEWKLLAYRSGKVALFNIKKDKEEEFEVSQKYPEIVKKMLNQLRLWENEMGISKYSGIQNK